MSAIEVTAVRRRVAAPAHENLHAFSTFGLRLAPRVAAGLSACLEAFRYAEDLDCDPWNFAVEYSTLRRLNLSRCDLRWLVGRDLLHCLIETSLPGDSKRSFEQPTRPLFGKRTCFVLTKQGAEIARAVYGLNPSRDHNCQNHVDTAVLRPTGSDETPVIPKWDRARQRLSIGQIIIKQFKVPAANQGTVLAAFEEEAWPPRIDDPLPPHREQSPKRRLQETIKSLNRNHQQRLIRFVGDGNAMGVRWEFCDTAQLVDG